MNVNKMLETAKNKHAILKNLLFYNFYPIIFDIEQPII
jgi:hypothetical protein